MPPGRQRSDEERRAMWARMGGGGGRGGSAGGASGSWEGQDGGASGSFAAPDGKRYAWERPLDEQPIVEVGWPSWLGPGGIGKAAGAIWKIAKPALVSFGTGMSAGAIEKYRKANPDLSPEKQHYLAATSTYLSYASAITGLMSFKAGVKAITPEKVAKGVGWLPKKLGEFLGWTGNKISSWTPGQVKAIVAPIGKISGKIADITGATMTDVANIGRNLNTLKRSGEIQKQATAIEAIAGHLSSQQKAKALSYLDEAYRRSSTGKSGAAALYQASRDAFHAAEKGSRTSKFAADKMRALGDKLAEDARSGVNKAAFAVAGTIAKEVYDETKINSKRADMRKVFDENDTWTEPAEPPMSMARMIAAAVAGVHGNMAEKPISRYGSVDHIASSAAWRAKHDMITDALKDGVIDQATATKSYKALQDEEPFVMAGKAPWLTAPASAAAIVWKVGDQIAKAGRSTTDRRQIGSYIDGDTLTGDSGRTNRLLDINAPEVAHEHSNDPNHPERRTGEYLGPESAALADKLIKEGQYFRRVEDSNPEAGGTTYGRDVRSIETLPRPFDKLLAIPGLGDYIPAQDFATRMIRAGMGDIDYRELTKYKGDNLRKHDEARLAAQADQIGIWSKPAQDAYAEYARTNANFKPWVGTEDTMYDRKVKREKKKGFDIPKEPASDWGTWAGLGLMTSGQSGLFGAMGEGPGSAAAWGWNAGVAIAGLYDHTQKAIRNPAPRKYYKQPGVPSALDRRVAQRDRESRELSEKRFREKSSSP